MTSLDEQLDQFAGEPKEPAAETPKKRTRRKHVDAFSTGQPAPGEERTAVNLRHWNALGRTDPAHTKPFRRPGGFAGTAIKPIWTEKLMTEHFGPAGAGWGMGKPEFQLVPVEGNGELLVYCTVRLWYREADREAEVYGVGGDKVIARGREGLRTSDEAFKSAYTDALSNAMKHLGVAADVHMGLFDDSKYVREMVEVFSPPPEKPPGNGHAADPDAESHQLSPEHAKEIIRAAVEKAGYGRVLFREWYEESLTDDERIALRPHIKQLKEICVEADKLPAKPARKSAAA